jgi:hypothetical protein
MKKNTEKNPQSLHPGNTHQEQYPETSFCFLKKNTSKAREDRVRHCVDQHLASAVHGAIVFFILLHILLLIFLLRSRETG